MYLSTVIARALNFKERILNELIFSKHIFNNRHFRHSSHLIIEKCSFQFGITLCLKLKDEKLSGDKVIWLRI